MTIAPNRIISPRTQAALGMRSSDALDTLTRAITAISRTEKGERPDTSGLDRATIDAIEKSAVVPIDTTNATTGAVFGATGVAEIMVIAGPSAFKELASRAVAMSLDRNAALLMPFIEATSDNIGFFAQGAPFPQVQATLDGVRLTTRKAGVGITLTNELVRSPNAEVAMRKLLQEKVSQGLDKLLLDAIETDGVRPSGLRFGVAAETSGGALAMQADLAEIGANVVGVAGSLANIIYIASPDIALKIAINLPMFPFPVFASAGLAASGTCAAVATNGLAVAASPTIRFESSDQTVVHSDTAPVPISVAGTPNVVAAPAISLWQVDASAIRVIFEIDWAWRAPGAISWMESIPW